MNDHAVQENLRFWRDGSKPRFRNTNQHHRQEVCCRVDVDRQLGLHKLTLGAMESHGIVIADTTGVIRYWSTGAENMFGHPADVALAQSLDLIVPANFRGEHWKGFRAAVENGSAELDGQSTTFPVRCADGNVTEFLGSLTLLRDAQRQVIGVMVIFEPNDAK